MLSKAKIIADNIVLTDFKASNGWLCCFRNRHHIQFKTLCGESAAMHQKLVDDWKANIDGLLRKCTINWK